MNNLDTSATNFLPMMTGNKIIIVKQDTTAKTATFVNGLVSDYVSLSATDTTPPTATVTATIVNNSTSVNTAQSTETGTIYLVKQGSTVTDKASLDTLAAGSDANSATVTTANTNTTILTTGLTDGAYKVYAADDAGNVSAASTNSVTLDSTVPTAIVQIITDITSAGGSSFTIDVQYQDAASNIGTASTDDIKVTYGGNTLNPTGAAIQSGSGSDVTIRYTFTPPRWHLGQRG
ncbi:MAG: hypothetical protein HC888_19535 [Candidatus Competibacteraceae bacterium]|nr:hypothetical protein [Candidatus Competibacteraceae bacterium]